MYLYTYCVFCSRFLYEVQEYAYINKMVSSNLGTVFGPNLLRPEVSLHITINSGYYVGACAYIFREAFYLVC